MFIWDFVADTVLGQIVDWIYGQMIGFLGNFFSLMGQMGAELFELDWIQAIVLFSHSLPGCSMWWDLWWRYLNVPLNARAAGEASVIRR